MSFSKVGMKLEGPGKDPHEVHLKKIAEALDKYHEAKGSYPPPGPRRQGRQTAPELARRPVALHGRRGKGLYKEFKLDEPWDSLHNKKLLKKLPKVPTRRTPCTGSRRPHWSSAAKAPSSVPRAREERP